VSHLLEPQAREKGITLRMGECPDSAVAMADPVKVEQVILNLCSNAVKFTSAGGRVEVTCATGDGRVSVAVSDTGEGIAPDQLDRIFEPFVQLGRSLTSSREGTGLGLAISRDMARAMGGDLTVRSRLGAGSTFTFTLPAADPQPG
jgi:signal transduction histidine kinase